MTRDCSYRENFQKNVELSGWDATVYAEYKALRLEELCASFVDKPISILDFGCADGIMTSFIKQMFREASVVGVDISAEHIEVARMAYEDIAFLVSDKTIPAEDNQFDLVMAAETFHHISFDQHDHFMRELQRVLKPGGRFVLLELNPLNPATLYRFWRDPCERGARLLWPWYARKMMKRFFCWTQLCYSVNTFYAVIGNKC